MEQSWKVTTTIVYFLRLKSFVFNTDDTNCCVPALRYCNSENDISNGSSFYILELTCEITSVDKCILMHGHGRCKGFILSWPWPTDMDSVQPSTIWTVLTFRLSFDQHKIDDGIICVQLYCVTSLCYECQLPAKCLRSSDISRRRQTKLPEAKPLKVTIFSQLTVAITQHED